MPPVPLAPLARSFAAAHHARSVDANTNNNLLALFRCVRISKRVCVRRSIGRSVGRSVGNALVKIAEIRPFAVSELGRSEEEGTRRKKQGAAWRKEEGGRSGEEQAARRKMN